MFLLPDRFLNPKQKPAISFRNICKVPFEGLFVSLTYLEPPPPHKFPLISGGFRKLGKILDGHPRGDQNLHPSMGNPDRPIWMFLNSQGISYLSIWRTLTFSLRLITIQTVSSGLLSLFFQLFLPAEPCHSSLGFSFLSYALYWACGMFFNFLHLNKATSCILLKDFFLI